MSTGFAKRLPGVAKIGKNSKKIVKKGVKTEKRVKVSGKDGKIGCKPII